MAQDQHHAPNTGNPLVVTLGRWAGFFTIASALALGVWQTIIVADQTPLGLDLKIFTLWRAVMQIAPWGVVIILLAEIADRLLDDGDLETEGNEYPSEYSNVDAPVEP